MPRRSPNHLIPTPSLSNGLPRLRTGNQPAPLPQPAKAGTLLSPIKSLVRNILLTSPCFLRLYVDAVLSSAPNSNAANILARDYQKKIIDGTNRSAVRQAETHGAGGASDVDQGDGPLQL